MCKTIQEVLETNKKIFIMGGNNHFNFVEQGVEGIDYAPSIKYTSLTVLMDK